MAVFLLFFCVAASCKKDKGPTRTEMLTDKPWRTVAITVSTFSTGSTTDE
ncbi:MAG: hypothetical protein H7Y27_04775 [Gemmatimonadaceae bacterium]|nr:hypothetical protein [Chitinophagaceae bacterium]